MSKRIIYWTLDKMVSEARVAMEKEGWNRLPSQPTMSERGYSKLAATIARYEGGFREFRKYMGQETRKPAGYWQSEENILAEARSIMEKEGWDSFPGVTQIRKSYASLAAAICTDFEGGPRRLRELLGGVNLKVSPGYWDDPENVINEARSIMEKEGWKELPSRGIMSARGYSPLAGGVMHYPGGIRGLREKLGQQNPSRAKKYWQSEENILAEARSIMEKEGWKELPSQIVLNEKGYSALTNAAKNMGLRGLREKLGQQNHIKPVGYYTEENILAEARSIMEKEGWKELPSCEAMRDQGYSALVTGIFSNGGIRGLREKLGQQNRGKSPGYWNDLENIIKEVRGVMEKEGWKELPSCNLLTERGYTGLVGGISKKGGIGFAKLRKALGQESLRTLRGYWKDTKNILREAMVAMEKEGWDRLPGGKSLTNNGYGGLANAISAYYPGAYPSLRKDLGEGNIRDSEKDQIEGLLEKYVGEGHG